ncbi:MAG: LacI family DNA-binding transcriptional regulator [Trueperaceae bacterium]
MATIKDVSQRARVSPATVSRVINGGSGVSEATRGAVLAVIAELGYQPNAFARSLATNRSGGIGVVVSEVSSAVYGGILQGIESVTERHGMHILVSSGHARAERERKAFHFLRQRRSDALILQLDGAEDAEVVAWSRHGVPIIVVGRYIDGLADRCVFLDNVAGGELATRHLLDRGHRRIAHIAGLPSIQDARDRFTGYLQALADHGIPFDASLVADGGFVEQGGQRAMRQLLEGGQPFTAVFAANDQSAAGAMRTLRDAGLRVPDDVSVVGFDDTLLANYLVPSLTTVRQPLQEMGQAAASLALARLGIAAREEVTLRFEPVLVERESVAAPHSGHTPA